LISITPGAPQTDYTQFYNANANCYEYNQIISVLDNAAPVIDNCPASPVNFGDVTSNDGQLWNDPFFNDPIHNIHDLCEMPVDLSINASDICAGTNVNIRYLLFLDTDNSGDMETVVNSANPPAYGFINVGNALNPNFGGGNPLRFDKRPVPADQVWRFGLQTTVANGKKTGRVGFNTLAAPNTYVLPQLPHGTHKIKWLVQDGCGNEATCEYTFVIRDTKPPTVVCLNGISVNIMPTQMIQIWDTELLQYTVDNCTPDAQMAQANKTGICTNCTSFPLDAQGNPIKQVTFTCAQLGTQTVRIWSRDAMGNADFCATYVLVQDNNGNCVPGNNPGNKVVAGDIKGQDKLNVAQGLEDADVAIVGTHPALPNINLNPVTNVAGHFQTNPAVPVLANFTVTPVKDGDYLNGVDMLDVLKIQRHILGLEPLPSAYRQIAADVNNTGSITASDITELRKLILGAYTELPNVGSYRFVDGAYVFPNPNNPFVPKFPELISVAQLQDDKMDNHFEAVKMGDVTGNAVFNTVMSADDRTAGTLLFDIADRKVAKGEEFTVDFTAAERVLGYQFTMNAKGLTILDVVPGAGMDVNNFAVFAAKGAMTTVVEDASAANASFSVKFRATEAGDLSRMLSVSSAITKAVSYSNDAERHEVGFRFNGQNGSVISGVGFELYQNQPNPFINSTVVGFHLPEATTATLSVYDELGRTLFTQKGDFAKGYNAITIDRSKLNTTGVMFYSLETANQSATKQMIQTK
jgi:Dockerin type I domain